MPHRPPSPLRTSPSQIARYFFHDCERFLRYSATPRESLEVEGVPERSYDKSRIMQAIIEQGFEWEAEVIRSLGDAVHVAPGKGKLVDRRFTVAQTKRLLAEVQPGEYIYQPSLKVPLAFYDAYGLDPALVDFGTNHPDLVAVLAGDEQRRLLRVLDLKRGRTLSLTYRVQIMLYALELRAVLEQLGISDADVDLETGAAWLGWTDEPAEFEMKSIRPTVELFLRDDLPRILSARAEDAHWHLYYRCEWCEYFDHCRAEMRERDDLSRLAHLSVQGKRHLRTAADVHTVVELETFIGKDPDGADRVLAECATLMGRRPILANQAGALVDGSVRVHGASTPALPKHEDVSIVVTLQEEPLGHTIYLAGLLVSATRKARERLAWDRSPEPQVFVAPHPTDDQLAALRRSFVEALYSVLDVVDRYNTGREWREQMSLQFYVHTERERVLLVSLLMEAVRDPDLAAEAMPILLHVHGPDLMQTDEHPADTVPYPAVVLLNVLGRLLALPVDTSYGLPETLAALGCDFTYHRRDFFHFPLGHGFRAEAIHSAWNGGQADTVGELERIASQHLYAVRALLWDLRRRVSDHLFSWPPKFVMPASSGITNPILSRLAFFCQYESLLACLAVRERRTELREVLALRGELIELTAVDSHSFDVASTVELDETRFPNWLLARDTTTGRRAVLEYPDLFYRDKAWGGREHADRAVVSIQMVQTDQLGYASRVRFDYARPFSQNKPTAGERFLLFPRYTDYTTQRIVSFLHELDDNGDRDLLDLLTDPKSANESLDLAPGVRDAARAVMKASRPTPSQRATFGRILENSVTLVWGPPGTGKTHFLASAIVALAEAHRRAGAEFRVFVTAFTHAAIENVLRHVVRRRNELSREPSEISVAKAKSWQGVDTPEVAVLDENVVAAWLRSNPVCVLGGTVWTCLKKWEDLPFFDLVVVDEASQVRVPEASVPIGLVESRGRLVLAGDDLQLPPIVQGIYPQPEEDEPILHRSIFEAVRSAPAGEELILQLVENFRMNDVLTGFAAKLLYGPNYRCVSDEIAKRRLPLHMKRGWSKLVRYCLDPEFPMVLALLDARTAGKENEQEARLVTDLVLALRDGLHDEQGKLYEDDEEFFKSGVFLVSPHHVQIRLIRRLLASEREWTSPPFIDTVEKIQGQQAEAVIVSYGVADPEYALQEAAFIYSLNRLNVAITRARTKSIVCIPRALLAAVPPVLEIPEAAAGLGFMRGLVEACRQSGESETFEVGDGVGVKVVRAAEGGDSRS